jgi:hypothetical protein
MTFNELAIRNFSWSVDDYITIIYENNESVLMRLGSAMESYRNRHVVAFNDNRVMISNE